MRRETRKWLKTWATREGAKTTAADALATDAEVRRLRAALKRIAAIPASVGRGYFPPSHAMMVNAMKEHAEAALKPRKAKSLWSSTIRETKRELRGVKVHVCSTTSGDEQVLCDDAKCPRGRNFKAKRHG